MKQRAGDYERDRDSGLLLPRHARRGLARVHPQFMAGPMFFGASAVDPLFASVKYLTNTGSPNDLSSAATTVTNTAVTSSGSPAKFGATSMAFNGTSSKLVLGATAKIASTDCAVEAWVYQTNHTNLQFIWSQYDNSGGGDFANRSALYIDSSGHLGFQRGSLNIAGTTAITLNAWHFVEVSRSSGTVYVFLDGGLEVSSAITGQFGNFNPAIGNASGTPPASAFFAGNMSPVRITVGSARNTSGYAVPTAQFPTS
jgi:hypothetical protein